MDKLDLQTKLRLRPLHHQFGTENLGRIVSGKDYINAGFKTTVVNHMVCIPGNKEIQPLINGLVHLKGRPAGDDSQGPNRRGSEGQHCDGLARIPEELLGHLFHRPGFG